MSPIERFVRRVWAIASKESAHIRRDPRTMYMALGMPVVMVILFGFGIRFDVDHVPVAFVDEDHTAASRALVDDLVASGDLVFAGEVGSVDEGEVLLRRNEASALVVIPEGLSKAVHRRISGRPSAEAPVDVQILVDGSDGSAATQVLGTVDALARAATSGGATGQLPLSAAVSVRYNPAGESALFLLPGTIAYVLAMTAVLLTALSVAREWERGSMEQLFATPVGRGEIILGKLLPYLGLGLVGVLLVLASGVAIFGLPIRGSLVLVLFSSLLFLVGMLGQGLLVSVVTKNQMVATQVGTFSSMLPSMLLSGFLVPVDNLPLPLKLASFLVPARWFIATLRAVLLKGAGLDVVWPWLLGLALFATVMLVAATARFQRRIA
jgi:ABC-2 type transport system permease protein